MGVCWKSSFLRCEVEFIRSSKCIQEQKVLENKLRVSLSCQILNCILVSLQGLRITVGSVSGLRSLSHIKA